MADKLPAFQFYPGDWRKSPDVQACSFAARGLWVELLCLMFESPRRGYLELNGKPVTVEQLARMVGGTVTEVAPLLEELEAAGVFSRDERGVIFSRRMDREQHIRSVRSEAGKKGAAHGAKGGRPCKGDAGDSEERAALVQGLHANGMSLRAIASSVGVDKRTVARDLKTEVGKTGAKGGAQVGQSGACPTHDIMANVDFAVYKNAGNSSGANGKNGKPNGKITPSSSSSSSSSSEYIAADAARDDTEPSEPKPPRAKKPRERNPLFDAVAEVTGFDPATAGSLIGKVAAALAAAEPAYTPDDVRAFGRRFLEFCPHARGERTRPNPGELQKWIGRLRADSKAPPVTPAHPTKPNPFLTPEALSMVFDPPPA